MKPIGVMGISREEDTLLRALDELQRNGYSQLDTFAPIPSPRLLDRVGSRPSPVRVYTLLGGIAGFLSGLALTVLTSTHWPVLTGGKPIVSIPPFLVITFELTILVSGLSTAAGWLIHGVWKPAREPRFDPRFSTDRYGVFVECERARLEHAQQLLKAAGMEEVLVEGL